MNPKITKVYLITTIEESLCFDIDDFAFLKIFDLRTDYIYTYSHFKKETYSAGGLFLALKKSADVMSKWSYNIEDEDIPPEFIIKPFDFIRRMHNICAIGIKFDDGTYDYISMPYIYLNEKKQYNILQRSGVYTEGELVVEIRKSIDAQSIFDVKNSGCVADEVIIEDYYMDPENNIWELKYPENDFERELLAKRVIQDYRETEDVTVEFRDGYLSYMNEEEIEADRHKSHDYLNWDIPFKDLGRPRNHDECALFRYRHERDYDYDNSYLYEPDFGDIPPSQEEIEIVKAFYAGRIGIEEADKRLSELIERR